VGLSQCHQKSSRGPTPPVVGKVGEKKKRKRPWVTPPVGGEMFWVGLVAFWERPRRPNEKKNDFMAGE